MPVRYVNKILEKSGADFSALSLEAFRMQYQFNPLYQAYANCFGKAPENVSRPEEIPFLPIRFFTSHRVETLFPGEESVAETVFASSGTTGATTALHYVRDAALYKHNFLNGFRQFYGEPENWCILGLLPSYLERNNSSLVFMVNELMRQSGHPQNGFFLHEFDMLHRRLQELEKTEQPTLLFGVSFALLDFSERFPLPLQHTRIIETGGMKGRGRELVREELHALLAERFGRAGIHSEYGMTELLSQAWAQGGSRFTPASTMRVLMREADDPLTTRLSGRGALNVIDLANIYSCCFIATEDQGRVHENGQFEVLGRLDYADARGCSMLAL